ncbi:MAG: hypothetical protein LBG07_06550 [Treponema sp.]|nr:hypothetical protein [Treponema sp.]
MAFGQVPDGLSFGGWGRAVFVPVQGQFKDGEDAVFKSGVGAGWKPAYMGVNIRFSAADGRVGGGADLSHGEGGNKAVGIGDNVNIWAKPFGSDILLVKIGKYRHDYYRGPGTDGNFQSYVGGPGKSGDAVFNRLGINSPDGGALFESTPISGLSIFAEINPGWDTWGEGIKAADAYKKIQAGLGYKIPNIGFARAQWVGNTMDGVIFEPTDNTKPYDPVTNPNIWKGNSARIEAAFKLEAVEGLNLDIGIKIPIPVKEENSFGIDTIYQGNFQLALAGDFTAGDFGITYGLYGAFGGSTAIDVPNAKRAKLNPTFDLILIPSFKIAAIDAKVGVDLGFKVKGESTTVYSGTKNGDRETIFGFGGWIERNLGNGLIKTGLAYQLPAYKENGIQGQTGIFTWPIILEVSF